MSTPAVSIVIPLYNKSEYVLRAIRSVLAQTFVDFELIVVDDGSTDDGVRKAESLKDSRIRIISQPNAGESAARNRGIAESRSDLVALLDADDEWLPDYLETVMALRERFPHAAAWTTPSDRVSRTGVLESWKGTAPRILQGDGSGGIIDYFSWKGNEPFNSSTVTMRKQALVSIGQFPVGLACGADVDTWLRLAFRFPIAWHPKPKAIYHKDVPGQTDPRCQIWEGVPPYFESLRRFIAEKGGQQYVPREMVDCVMQKHYTAFEMNLAIGNRKALSRIAKDFSRMQGYRFRGLVYQLLSLMPTCISRRSSRLKRLIRGSALRASGARPLYPGAEHAKDIRVKTSTGRH